MDKMSTPLGSKEPPISEDITLPQADAKEPSNREIFGLLQTIKADVDDLKDVVRNSSLLPCSMNTDTHNLCPDENVSPSHLIRITERWDEVNPKPSLRRGPVFLLQKKKRSQGNHSKSTKGTRSCTSPQTIASSSGPISSAKLLPMRRDDDTPFATFDRSALRDNLGTRRNQLRAATSQPAFSGDTMADWTSASDCSLMLLYKRIREERRRRMNEATAADDQDRLRVFGFKHGDASPSKTKESSK